MDVSHSLSNGGLSGLLMRLCTDTSAELRTLPLRKLDDDWHTRLIYRTEDLGLNVLHMGVPASPHQAILAVMHWSSQGHQQTHLAIEPNQNGQGAAGLSKWTGGGWAGAALDSS
jgi:hypothetical protein